MGVISATWLRYVGSFKSGARRGMAFKSSREAHLIFGILDGDEIIVSAFRVHPIARGDHGVGGEGGDDVIHNFLGGEAEFTRTFAIDVHFERGIIHILGNVDIRHARKRLEFSCQVERDAVGRLQIACR